MIETLLSPFTFGFMREAFLIGAIVAIPTAMLSCFLVLKGWALMGDAVSHAVLPGIVLAYILNFPLIIGAFAAGMVTALATGYLAENSRIKQDTVMGVVFSGMFGLGIVLYTSITSDVHLDHILFGNILGVGKQDLLTAGSISAVAALVLAVKWRDLMLFTFDPAQARASGLRVGLLHYGLLTILSLTIVATLTATGLILAVGLLIAPGAIAFLMTRSFGRMLVIVVVTCLGSMIVGIYASFFIGSEPAPTVILTLTAIFVVALIRRTAQIRRTTSVTVPPLAVSDNSD